MPHVEPRHVKLSCVRFVTTSPESVYGTDRRHLLCRGASVVDEPSDLPEMTRPEPSQQMHPLSPRLSAQFRPGPGPGGPISRSVSNITTASNDAGMLDKAAPDQDGSSGSGTGPITPEQMPPVVPTDASLDFNRLKEENSSLSQK